ncbi:FtsX-like permease family protein [compost metagenome]
MNILREYTLDYIRRNKKSSLSIMAAILISTVLLSSLCGAFYTFYTNEIRDIKESDGNWHAELFNHTPGEKLKYITGHPNVESVMVKGSWSLALTGDERRPYLAFRGFNESYWRDMPEGAAILEGRIPQAKDELAVSKQYFDAHPGLKVGDQLTLSLGKRMLNGKVMELIAPYQLGESFIPDQKQTYTVVAKLDMFTSSINPYYLACGYLDEADIPTQDDLTVYMRFKHIRSTYEDINRIAQSVGYTPDEYGKYQVKTHDTLLAKYLIFPPEKKRDFSLWAFSQQISTAIMAVLVAAVFVFIIHNAFAMSANARLRQLGMLQSIGASPRQIRQSVVFEGMFLAAAPVPLGLFIGWALDYGLFQYLNYARNLLPEMKEIRFSFGWPVALPTLVLAFLTVWLSALLPAWKVSRLTPIHAIRQGDMTAVKKLGRPGLYARLFGTEGELAQNALRARRGSYRTATISLTLSFLLFSLFWNLLALSDAKQSVSAAGKAKSPDIVVYLKDGHMTDPQFEEAVLGVAGITSAVFTSSGPAGIWLTSDAESAELRAAGGLKRISESGKYAVYEENGRFRLKTSLVALDDRSFDGYCRELGIDTAAFYDKQTFRTILINSTRDDINSTPRQEIRIPLLKLETGDRLRGEEKLNAGDTGDYVFETEIGFMTDKLPFEGFGQSSYQVMQIMPRSQYVRVVEHFQPTRTVRAQEVTAILLTESDGAIHPAVEELNEICSYWYGSGDYSAWNRLDQEQTVANGRRLLKALMLFVSGLLALIGISNVFSTISGNLRQRKREFAMLQSVGISSKGIRRMLVLEGIILGLMPIVLSLPVNVVVVGAFLRVNMTRISEFLPFLPILPLSAFGAAILLAVLTAYRLGGSMLRKASIADTLRDDTV